VRPGALYKICVDAVDDRLQCDIIESGLDVSANISGGEQCGHRRTLLRCKHVGLTG
jgi:hypothetical protein